MSMPQPFEHSTHADLVQSTSPSGTPCSRNRSTRTGQAEPAGCGVRDPQMSAMRSAIVRSADGLLLVRVADLVRDLLGAVRMTRQRRAGIELEQRGARGPRS